MTFPRDEAGRLAEFHKTLPEAWRAGRGDPHEWLKTARSNLHYWEQQLRLRWKQRHHELSLRSEGWPEPRRSEVAAAWDDYDREHHVHTNTMNRKSVREAIDGIRAMRWLSAHLVKPEVISELEAGPSYEYLHWGTPFYSRVAGRMEFTEPTVLDSSGRVVAQITREPSGNGPTIKACIFVRPGVTTEAPLTWCLFRQRKQARAWLVKELARRRIAIFGNDIDLPEWVR